MDARIDPMDEAGHPELVDLLRRSSFSEALNLFTRLIKLAHNQGQIDGLVGVVQRVAETAATAETNEPPFDLEAQMRATAVRQ